MQRKPPGVAINTHTDYTQIVICSLILITIRILENRLNFHIWSVQALSSCYVISAQFSVHEKVSENAHIWELLCVKCVRFLILSHAQKKRNKFQKQASLPREHGKL